MPSLTWYTIGIGPTTGIDWDQLSAMTRTDPYLCWLDLTRFAGAGVQVAVPLLLEARRGFLATQVEARLRPYGFDVAPVYLNGPPTRYLTAIAPSPMQLLHAQRLVDDAAGPLRRYEVSAGFFSPAGAVASQTRQPGPSASLVGFVDLGCAFAQRRFDDSRPNRGTRIVALWNQQVEPPGPPPLPKQKLAWKQPLRFRYGRDVYKADIDRYVDQFRVAGRVDDEACYRWAEYEAVRQHATHGTHVMDVACGRSDPLRHRARPGNRPPAPDNTPLAFVQLPQRIDQRPVSGLLRAQLLDALRYLESLLDPTEGSRRAVFNVSYGGYCGPHDGSSIIEGAMDELIRRHRVGTHGRRRVQIVIPAGNALDQALHAQVALATGARDELHWNTLADDPSDNFVEVWIPAGAAVSVSIAPPAGLGSAQSLEPGQARKLCNAAADVLAVAVYAKAVCQGERGTMLLLAAAGSSMVNGRPAMRAGRWTIGLHNQGNSPVQVDAWCERDQPIFGTEGGPRQSWFSTHVEPTGTCNAIAHGYETLVVGGYSMHVEAPRGTPPGLVVGPPAPYSGTGPGRSLPGRERHPGQASAPPLVAPDLLAPADDAAGRSGIAASAVLGEDLVSLAGTSIAAAAATRHIVRNGFAEPQRWAPTNPIGPPTCPPGALGSDHPDRCADIPRIP